jgi:hypothetical protein
MMVNQNNVGSFYGQRPALSSALPGQIARVTSNGTLSGLGTEAAKIYIPGSIGTQLVGKTIDKLADKLGQIIQTYYPALGTALYFITDAIAWAIKPTAKYLGAMVGGVVLYCPEVAANKVLDYIDQEKNTLAVDAFKDTLFAFYKRVQSTGGQATDIKQGRDKILGVLIKGVLDTLGVGLTGNRLAAKIYAKAMEAGATDWQAGAAVGYGVVAGLPSIGVPKGFSVKIPLVGTTYTVTGGAQVGAEILSVPEVATTYLSKLASPPTLTKEWISKAFTAKSGVNRGKIGKTGKTDGGGASGALPLLAAAALAFLASRG